jgi:hypothetical protein
MRIALVDITKNKRYNIGLLRIGSWLKSQDHTCELFINRLPGKCDQIWISTQFTFYIPLARQLAQRAVYMCDEVVIGGVAPSLLPDEFSKYGFDVHQGIIPDADKCEPDYTLLTKAPRYSVTTTSHGCIRKCPFCVVHKIEPDFVDRPHWPGDIHRMSAKIEFYDNNWLAKPFNLLERDSELMHTICHSGRIKKIDFNQGLDARLLTDKKADLLTGLPINPVRFAFDNMSEDGHFQSAISRMVERGFKYFSAYVLWNFKDTPRDFYYRLKETHKLSQELGVYVVAYPMRYQPIAEVRPERDYTGEHWTERQRKNFIASFVFVGARKGQISLFGNSPVKNFEYWYGHNGDDFASLLNREDFQEIMKFRQGTLQAFRANTQKPESWDAFWNEFSEIGT